MKHTTRLLTLQEGCVEGRARGHPRTFMDGMKRDRLWISDYQGEGYEEETEV